MKHLPCLDGFKGTPKGVEFSCCLATLLKKLVLADSFLAVPEPTGKKKEDKQVGNSSVALNDFSALA